VRRVGRRTGRGGMAQGSMAVVEDVGRPVLRHGGNAITAENGFDA
jgi:hypothetical protein